MDTDAWPRKIQRYNLVVRWVRQASIHREIKWTYHVVYDLVNFNNDSWISFEKMEMIKQGMVRWKKKSRRWKVWYVLQSLPQSSSSAPFPHWDTKSHIWLVGRHFSVPSLHTKSQSVGGSEVTNMRRKTKPTLRFKITNLLCCKTYGTDANHYTWNLGYHKRPKTHQNSLLMKEIGKCLKSRGEHIQTIIYIHMKNTQNITRLKHVIRHREVHKVHRSIFELH